MRPRTISIILDVTMRPRTRLRRTTARQAISIISIGRRLLPRSAGAGRTCQRRAQRSRPTYRVRQTPFRTAGGSCPAPSGLLERANGGPSGPALPAASDKHHFERPAVRESRKPILFTKARGGSRVLTIAASIRQKPVSVSSVASCKKSGIGIREIRAIRGQWPVSALCILSIELIGPSARSLLRLI